MKWIKAYGNLVAWIVTGTTALVIFYVTSVSGNTSDTAIEKHEKKGHSEIGLIQQDIGYIKADIETNKETNKEISNTLNEILLKLPREK